MASKYILVALFIVGIVQVGAQGPTLPPIPGADVPPPAILPPAVPPSLPPVEVPPPPFPITPSTPEPIEPSHHHHHHDEPTEAPGPAPKDSAGVMTAANAWRGLVAASILVAAMA